MGFQMCFHIYVFSLQFLLLFKMTSGTPGNPVASSGESHMPEDEKKEEDTPEDPRWPPPTRIFNYDETSINFEHVNRLRPYPPNTSHHFQPIDYGADFRRMRAEIRAHTVTVQVRSEHSHGSALVIFQGASTGHSGAAAEAPSELAD
jgi:diadenosine tetraphosphatase ApaH/serine/threonine PP2A family protein phosphatase